jgi:Arc/MetJ-type ribon-helix-helix transcriptional regulator
LAIYSSPENSATFLKQAMDATMHSVQISNEVKDILDRLVADGATASEAEFVEQAVRRCAQELADDEDELIAAAQDGLEAIRRGDYTTISSPADAAAFFEDVWAESQKIAAELRASRAADAAAADSGSE